uniref:Protocadherin Fat 4-like n=1 Tax=Saccoglossus kowalevskii TaxID=10224 RepID=A0ABM0LXH1_SACKO|nr:PREDICTED: protocadherin Fat 4-like [Saccoglossus kowalevskii]
MVYISDVNDNAPQFHLSYYSASISETAMNNTPVVHAAATDPDAGENARITYYITDGNEGNQFHINPSTGQITLIGVLDREAVPQYILTVSAVDHGTPQLLSTTTQVVITVLDENDNAPVFAQSARSVDVAETLEVGELITIVSASDQDIDQNALINYIITGGNTYETFRIDQDSGYLYLAKPLDYETRNYYELSITARDNGRSPLTDTIKFEIHIRDTNDNAPVFTISSIIHQVTEGVEIGTDLIAVTATDPDSDINGDIVYSITTQEPPGEHFSIHPISGMISTSAEIDREDLPNGMFEIVVMAKDQAIPVSNRKSATKRVTIMVLDINDNAPVFVSQNAATIMESTLTGADVTTVTAVDPDAGSNGEVSYSLSESVNNPFSIHETTGKLTLSGYLLSSRLVYPLTVIATDHGSDRKSSSFLLNVIITSIANSGAIFTKSLYTANVYENSPIGTSMIRITASYPTNHNADIEYYITSIMSGNKRSGRDFVVDKQTGEITVGNELDREAGNTLYNIVAYAVDMTASTPQTRSTQIHVSLLDENDNPPRFDLTSYSVNILEDVNTNTVVTTVTATDADEGIDTQIAYRIVSGNDGKFYINEQTGQIRTMDELDRETTPSYTLAISASDGDLSSITTLDIYLLDANDNPPEFSKSVYAFVVSESETIGTSVGEVIAIDPDEGSNGNVTYSILEDWGQDRFSLDSYSGIFTLDKKLDFEEVQYYLIVVEASDGGTPSLSSSVSCYFSTTDVNDNVPIFDPSSYDAHVIEDVDVGYSVVKVTATDADAGPNGAISYSITAGDDGEEFQILEDGTIVTAKELDRELKEYYSLDITASDQPLEGTPQTATARVSIVIGDVNDNAPEFQNTNLTTVSEDAGAYTTVVELVATDADAGDNGDVDYSMESMSEFFLTSDDVIVVSDDGVLDRETDAQYVLTVYAWDKGVPRRTSTMQITVIIQDVNDNAPAFSSESYKVEVMENMPTGKEFFQVVATDADVGNNAIIEYHITNGNYNNDFSIDTHTGVLASENILDREGRYEYTLSVTAQDKGMVPLVSTATVTITLNDINDNIPQFESQNMEASINENNQVPALVTTCAASDPDEDSNGEMVFEILQVSAGQEGLFTIDTSGNVYVNEVLDRETIAEYHLNIQVSDNGNPSLTSSALLEIQVGDVNDNPPIFIVTNSSASVLEEQPINTTVTTVTARDADEGVNAHIKYHITNDKFTINPLTGEIRTNAVLNREENAIYVLEVIATDKVNVNSPDILSSTATVYVTVVDINDNDPAFEDLPYYAVIKEVEDYTGLTGAVADTYIYAASTNDADIGTNGLIHYAISKSNPQSKFKIGSRNGVVQVSSSLDAGDDYWVEITARDGGPGSYSIKTNLTVTFSSDSFPVFSTSPTSHFYSEDAYDPNDNVVTSVRATSSNGVVKYYMAAGNFQETFHVDRNRGEVTIEKPLDYEVMSYYQLWIEAKDDDHSSYISCTVHVTDVNDNAPVFTERVYFASVLEGEDSGTSVVTVSAIDHDSGSNGQVLYLLQSATDDFAIDSQTGELTTTKVLDRETNAFYTLTIHAVDQGTPSLTGTTTVEVDILDINDHAPSLTGWITVKSSLLSNVYQLFHLNVRASDQGNPPLSDETLVKIQVTEVNQHAPDFIGDPYSETVFENAQIGSSILTVLATDNDVGKNGDIRYSFASGNDDGLFAIGSENGVITVAEELDFEAQDTHILNVSARDLGVISLESFARVDVVLIDVNDNSPEFESQEYNPTIPENSPSGTSVVTCVATDADSTSNAVIVYKIIGGDGQYYFVINRQNGTIFSQSHLNYEDEKKSYELTVRAENEEPSMYDDTRVIVHITGMNEYYPEYIKHYYTYSVPENADDGQLVGIVAARDKDHGIDGQIRYVLVGGRTYEGFAIDGETGAIHVSYAHGTLDRESQDTVILLTLAKNGGVINGDDIDEAVVRINITDANDPPVFMPNSYVGNTRENSSIGVSVLTVSAEDYDLNEPDNLFSYEIVGGNINNAFAIDQQTGVISTSAVLDREEIQLYNLTVAAVDGGNPPQTGYAEVEISIDDVNDNGPMFYPEDTVGSVYENQSPGTSVMILSAYDPDTPVNGAPFSYYLLPSDDSEQFSVHQSTGLITTKASLNREDQSDYYLPIESRDSGVPQMTSTTRIHIMILDTNDNPSSSRSADIYVNAFQGVFPGGLIGIAHPLDPDVGDVFECEIVTADPMFSIYPGCELHSSVHSGIASYVLNISGSDTIHPSVYSNFIVDYHAFSNNSLNNSMTLVLGNIDAVTFLTSHFNLFYTSVSDELSSGETFMIIDLYDVEENMDLLVAIRLGGHQDVYYTRSDLASFFNNHEDHIEQDSGVEIIKIDYTPCENQPCINNGECTDHVEVYDNYIITDSNPIIFGSSQSQRVFVCVCKDPYFGERCEREPNLCESNPCLNGGTCHKDSLVFYWCECAPGFAGDLCDIVVDECESDPCKNGGTCHNHDNGYVCVCVAGYTGPDCDIEMDPCTPPPCFNEGECVPDDNGFTCECNFGERGDRCEFSSYSFLPMSYAQYESLGGATNWITMQFATTFENTLLLYNHDTNVGDKSEFIAIEVIDGKVWFSYNMGDGTTRVHTDKIVSDGEWHEIIATRERLRGVLKIDGCTDESLPPDYCFSSSQGVGAYPHLDLQGVPLNIGGIKTIDSITERPGQVSTYDFVGCMRDVYVDGIFLDLAEPLDSSDVSHQCPREEDMCESNPCQNGGTCIDEWWKYRCSCKDGFMGHHCEEEMSSFTFGDGSYIKYTIKNSFRRQKLLEGELKRKKRSTDPQTASLSFRTRHEDGLLFYMVDTEVDRYTILEVVKNKLQYIFSSGSLGTGSISLEIGVSDGEWHNATLTKIGFEVTLTLDGIDKTTTFDIPPHDFVSVEVQNIFLGGTEDPLNHDERNILGFEGCIDSFVMNDNLIPFIGESEIVVAEPSEGSTDSAIGCEGTDVCASNPCPAEHFCLDEWESYTCIPEGACKSDPCLNNGTCIPQDAGYLCICPKNYTGPQCDTALVCALDPCGEDQECIVNENGAYFCKNIAEEGSSQLEIIIVIVIIIFVLILAVIVFVIIYCHCRKKKSKQKQPPVVVNVDGIGNDAFTTDNDQKSSPTNSELARLGISGTQPDILALEQNKNVLVSQVDEDTTIMEDQSSIIPTNDEFYDLENASSIAPSDIDVTHHYRDYHRDGNRKLRNNHAHRMSPNHLHSRGVRPNLYAMNQLRHSPGLPSQYYGQMHRQSPHPRISPHHMMQSRASPIKELIHSRSNSEQSINQSELRSEPGFRSNASTVSENSRRTKSPISNGHLPNSRPQSRLKSPLTVVVDAEQPKGLSAEEVAMLNSARPNEHAGSLPSTLDGISSGSSDRNVQSVPFARNPQNLLEAPETSTDESNDSFTCSEYECGPEKLKFPEFDPSNIIFKRLAVVKEDDPNIPDTSRTYNYEGIDSAGGSLSTLQMSEDDIPHVSMKPPNGHFSWDYLLNWGPSFENLVGVFHDIALLEDGGIALKLDRDPSLEEYV